MPEQDAAAELAQLAADVEWLGLLADELGYRPCGVIRILTGESLDVLAVRIGAIRPRTPCVFEDGHAGVHSWGT